jgi:hypothetical protein
VKTLDARMKAWPGVRAYVQTPSNTEKPPASMSGTMVVSRKPAFSNRERYSASGTAPLKVPVGDVARLIQNERGQPARASLVLYNTVDFIFGDFNCQRPADLRHTGFVFAVAEFHLPTPAAIDQSVALRGPHGLQITTPITSANDL